MRVALYSTLARRDITAVRDDIAARRIGASADDIRPCRQDLMAMDGDGPAGRVAKLYDFFSLSNGRDLLFHVQERTTTVAEIADFIAQENLEFLGFETDPATQRAYSARFPNDASRTSLANWHAFEQDNPD